MKLKSKRILVFLIIFSFISSMVPLLSSCSKEAVFGELTICEKINEETKEPLIPKNDFDFKVKEIFSTIKVENVKGDENFRFLWKNIENDSIVTDITGKYREGESLSLSGWFSGNLTIKEGAEFLAFPGKYKIEFYHNGELKSSAEFTIKKPDSKITSVSLTDKVGPDSEPLNPKQEFTQDDEIYACAQLDFLVVGDTVKSKWLDDKNSIITEVPVTINDYFFKPSWVSFSFFSTNENPLPAGSYTVEILLNDAVYGSYPFTITAATEPESEIISFKDNNIFTEAEAKYYFTIIYPDDWNYTWQEDNTAMSVVFTPTNTLEALSTLMIVMNEGSYPVDASETKSFMDEIASDTKGEMEQLGEPLITQKKMLMGTPYTEYVYYFSDPDKGEFGLILSSFVANNKMYVWYGYAHKEFYIPLNDVYYRALNSLSMSN